MSTTQTIAGRLRSYQQRVRRILIGEAIVVMLIGAGVASMLGALWFSYKSSLELGLAAMTLTFSVTAGWALYRAFSAWSDTSFHSQVCRSEELRAGLRGRLFLVLDEIKVK